MSGKTLIENLKEINSQISDLFLLANPFFRLTKPTEENLSKYKDYKKRYMNLKTFFNIIRFPLIVIAQALWNISLSLITPWEWYPRQELGSQNNNLVGLSQVTTANPKFTADPLLGQIPMQLNQNDSLAMFYLNGTRISRGVLRKLLLCQDLKEVAINSKTLSPFETIYVQFLNFKASLILIKLIVKSNDKSAEKLYLFSEGLIYQFRRPTFANLVLLRRLGKVLEKNHTKVLFFTLEGHAHEAMVITLIKTTFPEVHIKAIQHAPIVLSQSGYFENLILLRQSDSVLCTGEIPKEFTLSYLENQTDSCRDVKVIGSSKSQQIFSSVDIALNRTPGSILFLPEGTEKSTIEFLCLFRYFARIFPDIQFVIRLHPAASSTIGVKKLLNEPGLNNAKISESSLSGDLCRAAYCVYRGTAAAIEGLAYGVIPIHYNNNAFYDLDPILMRLMDHPTAESIEKLNKIFQELSVNNSLLNTDSEKSLEYFNAYFAPEDIFNFY